MLMCVYTTVVLQYRNGYSVRLFAFYETKTCAVRWICYNEYVANITNGTSFYAHGLLCANDFFSGVVTGTRLSNPCEAQRKSAVRNPRTLPVNNRHRIQRLAHKMLSMSLCDRLPVSHGTKLVICSWVNRLLFCAGKMSLLSGLTPPEECGLFFPP